jgi:hypothetical protein
MIQLEASPASKSRPILRHRHPQLDNVQPALSDITKVTPTNARQRICEAAAGERLES